MCWRKSERTGWISSRVQYVLVEDHYISHVPPPPLRRGGDEGMAGEKYKRHLRQAAIGGRCSENKAYVQERSKITDIDYIMFILVPLNYHLLCLSRSLPGSKLSKNPAILLHEQTTLWRTESNRLWIPSCRTVRSNNRICLLRTFSYSAYLAYLT